MIEEVTEQTPTTNTAASNKPDEAGSKDRPVRESEEKTEPADGKETRIELSAEEPNHKAPEDTPAGEEEK